MVLENGMTLRSKSNSEMKEQLSDLKGSKAKSIRSEKSVKKSDKASKVSKFSSDTKNSDKNTETIVLGNKTCTINVDSVNMKKS